jgi:hypothetical protein
MFLAREIIEPKKCKLDGRSSGFGVPYRFYVGIKTEFLDFIEQNRTFDSLGEDLGYWRTDKNLPFARSLVLIAARVMENWFSGSPSMGRPYPMTGVASTGSFCLS